MILYIFNNPGKFKAFETQRYKELLREYLKPAPNKKVKVTDVMIEDNEEALLARITK